ncbi:hypothetical protein RUND412_004255 [Rhizina undulata]
MKFTLSNLLMAAAFAAEAVSAAPTISYIAGFNLGANTRTNACKTTADYTQEFNKIKSWSTGTRGQFTTIKLYSTSDCDTILNAAPAAIATGMKIWAGVWNVDDAKFGREKAALESAIKQYGSSWLAGINVGSETLYRKETTAAKLAQQIYDVKGMVQTALGAPNVPVGCADTWTTWVDGANKAVIDAVDVVLMNGFPYWQGATIDAALSTFQTAISNTKAAIGSKPFIVGETGWPTVGPNYENAVASLDNLRSYWKSAGCWMESQGIPFFWFSAFDEPQRTSTIEQNFGAAWSGQTLKLSLSC